MSHNQRPTFPLMKQSDMCNSYYMKMPRWLFSDSNYSDMSLDAKVSYTLLLNRFQLSRLNNWVNEYGEVYIIFPRLELAKELRIGEKRVTAALKVLRDRQLIWEHRCGLGRANQIFLAKVEPHDDEYFLSAPFFESSLY